MLNAKPLDDASELLELDAIMAALRQQAEVADADPFDTLATGVKSAADAIKAEGDALKAATEPISRQARGCVYR